MDIATYCMEINGTDIKTRIISKDINNINRVLQKLLDKYEGLLCQLEFYNQRKDPLGSALLWRAVKLESAECAVQSFVEQTPFYQFSQQTFK